MDIYKEEKEWTTYQMAHSLSSAYSYLPIFALAVSI